MKSGDRASKEIKARFQLMADVQQPLKEIEVTLVSCCPVSLVLLVCFEGA